VLRRALSEVAHEIPATLAEEKQPVLGVTLLNILGGLDVPTTGRLLYRGQDLTAASDRALTAYRRDHVGFVFQFYNLVPSLTALENVALVTDLARRPLSAEEALDLVGLSSRRDHYPAQLSGGEQQRVAIARAIAKRPDVLLCDEPTGALDVQTGKVVLEAIERVNRELTRALAVLGTTEDPGQLTAVRSPVSGSVLRLVRESAGPVAAGAPLLEIGDVTRLEVDADLLSSDAAEVRPDAAATVTGWGGPTTLRARVRRIDPAAFTKVSALGLEEQRVDVDCRHCRPWRGG
jgi:putative ABC transport system ATP-binding protein